MWLWFLLPVFLAVWGAVGFWVVYVMAVANGSVNITEAFPYISTCGSYPPQSCIFGQILNIGAVLVAVICYLKYQQLRDCGYHSCLNTAGLSFGLLCAIGASIVGNFQQFNQLETHLFGAILAFGFGILYFWIQAFLTYRVKPTPGDPWIGPIRFSLSVCGTVSLLASVVLFLLNLPSEAAYCEWILAMDLFLLFSLISVDFRSLETCSLHLQHRMTNCETLDIQVSTQALAL